MAGSGSTSLAIVPSASALLVEARSSVGLISFGTTSLTGRFDGRFSAEGLDVTHPIQATATVPVDSLVSGNALYDTEVRTRLNSLRYPLIEAELRTARELGDGRFSATGDLTIHGTPRPQSCTVAVSVTGVGEGNPSVVVTGTVQIDIRDYDIELPNVLMLRIYPDVTVRFRVQATADPPGEALH